MPEPFEIITFDCYGTLIDWETGIKDAFRAEAAKDGIEIQGDQVIKAYAAAEPSVESGTYLTYREVLCETALKVAAKLGLDLTAERAAFLGESLPHWAPFPDTNPALERLSKRYHLGILSNIDDELLDATRSRFTVDFDLVVTAQQVRSYKPGPAHFAEALARAGSRRLLHAAQSHFHDVVPARKLNIPVVWVNRKNEKLQPGDVVPTHEVRTLADLADLLGT